MAFGVPCSDGWNPPSKFPLLFASQKEVFSLGSVMGAVEYHHRVIYLRGVEVPNMVFCDACVVEGLHFVGGAHIAIGYLKW